MALLSQKKPSPSAPPSNEKTLARASKPNIKNIRLPDEAESQKKALQNLDQMVKNIYDTGKRHKNMNVWWSFNVKLFLLRFARNVLHAATKFTLRWLSLRCLHVSEVWKCFMSFLLRIFCIYFRRSYCTNNYQTQRCLPNSHSFNYTPNQHVCCNGCTHQRPQQHANGRHHKSHHPNHCSIL